MMEPMVLCIYVYTFSQSKHCLFRNVLFLQYAFKNNSLLKFFIQLLTGVAPDTEEIFPSTIFVPVSFVQNRMVHTAASR